MSDYLACRDMAAVFAFVHAHGNSYLAIGMATDLHPGRVAEIALGKRTVQAYDVFVRIAEGLKIPRHYIGVG
jgi:hypothetical protein